jgi:hypothetical protein
MERTDVRCYEVHGEMYLQLAGVTLALPGETF